MMVERSRLFCKSPDLVFMDRIFKRKLGIEINEDIYSQEYAKSLEEKVKKTEDENNYKINILKKLETEIHVENNQQAAVQKNFENPNEDDSEKFDENHLKEIKSGVSPKEKYKSQNLAMLQHDFLHDSKFIHSHDSNGSVKLTASAINERPLKLTCSSVKNFQLSKKLPKIKPQNELDKIIKRCVKFNKGLTKMQRTLRGTFLNFLIENLYRLKSDIILLLLVHLFIVKDKTMKKLVQVK